jgi:hypothetical protein
MKKISGLTSILSLAALSAPLLALADGINTSYLTAYTTGPSGIITIINTILVPLLIAIAFIVFLYGVFKYFILGGADEGSRTEGRSFILWGIIGFVVILSIWGIVNVVINTLGLSGGTNTAPPTFNTSATPTSGG